LGVLVEYNTKKVFDVKLRELRNALTDQIAENIDVMEVVDMVKQRRKEVSLPDLDVVRTIFDAIMDAVQWSGKNQQQNSNLALRQVVILSLHYRQENARSLFLMTSADDHV
jgi:hypothetical protein